MKTRRGQIRTGNLLRSLTAFLFHHGATDIKANRGQGREKIRRPSSSPHESGEDITVEKKRGFSSSSLLLSAFVQDYPWLSVTCAVHEPGSDEIWQIRFETRSSKARCEAISLAWNGKLESPYLPFLLWGSPLWRKNPVKYIPSEFRRRHSMFR